MAKSPLLLKEDYWSIWIGGFLLLLGIILFFTNKPQQLDQKLEEQQLIIQQEEARAPFTTVAWHQAVDAQQKFKGSGEPIGKFLKKLTDKPGSWKDNPLETVALSKAQAEQKKEKVTVALQKAQSEMEAALETAKEKEKEAATADFKDSALNNAAKTAIADWRVKKQQFDDTNKKYKVSAFNKLPYFLGLFLIFGLLFGLGSAVMGTPFRKFLPGFAVVFLIGLLAHFIAGQASMKAIGLGYALWAIVLGLLISNTIGLPEWLKPALSTEFYIKTGLVLLGAEILFGKILAIGLPGLFVAWVVTPIVFITTFWFGQRFLKIGSKTLNATISADMSVCGVSAAVATAAACKADKEELTLAVGLSMIFTSIMMVVLPAFINLVGMPEILGGAWIGGTIDATGAVVAAGAFLGEKALSVAATIKMIQNILIGVIAFGVAVYFATRVEKNSETTVGWGEIWKRFPRFILGFLGTSVVFSLLYSILGDPKAYTLIDEGVLGGFSQNLRGWLFCLAFVSIGLSTNFKVLQKHFSGGKPLLLYLVGQTFNLGLTLLMAYIMFYLVFPNITANI